MQRGLLLVLLPGLLLVAALLAMVWPKAPEITQGWANGTYANPCCAPVTLRDGVLSTAAGSASYEIGTVKGFYLSVHRGVFVAGGAVAFDDSPYTRIQINRDIKGNAHLLRIRDTAGKDVIFARR